MPNTIIPALLRRKESACYCGRSPASWDRLVPAGKTPKPIKLGGGILFRKSDLELQAALAKALAAMKHEGKHKKMLKEWLKP